MYIVVREHNMYVVVMVSWHISLGLPFVNCLTHVAGNRNTPEAFAGSANLTTCLASGSAEGAAASTSTGKYEDATRQWGKPLQMYFACQLEEGDLEIHTGQSELVNGWLFSERATPRL